MPTPSEEPHALVEALLQLSPEELRAFFETGSSAPTPASQAPPVTVAKIESRGLVVTAALGAVGLITAALIQVGLANEPPPTPPAPVACGTERNQAERAWKRNGGTWAELPESSPVEEQCDINGYIDGLPPPP